MDTAIDYLVDNGYISLADAFDCSLSGNMAKVGLLIKDIAANKGKTET